KCVYNIINSITYNTSEDIEKNARNILLKTINFSHDINVNLENELDPCIDEFCMKNNYDINEKEKSHLIY
ncbi:hypothetical protein KS664_003346, partial [Clostridium perfringens]|nr:hypothetical protein [Clostridium perfringens]